MSNERIERLAEIQARIAAACERVGRPASDVRLMLVTKTVAMERIEETIQAGHVLFGENRVQEALPKYEGRQADLDVHMIGHLQTNKVRQALRFARVIESVDRVSLVEELEKRLADTLGAGERFPVYMQVNTSGEASKFGVTPEGAVELAERIVASEQLELCGLMTIALLTSDAERARPCFVMLRELRDELQARGMSGVRELSMGMTSDFETAIEEGATIVRIGTAVFGERPTRDEEYWPRGRRS